MATNFLIDGAKSAGRIASDSARNIFNGVTRDNSLLNKFGLFTGQPPLQEEMEANKDGLFTRFKDKLVNDATDRYSNRDYINSITDSFKQTGVYPGEYEDNAYGEGRESTARHVAAASNTSDYVADLIGKVPFLNTTKYPSLIGDVASFGAGTIGEVKGSLFDFGKSVADGNMDTNYLSAFGQDMKDNFVGTFLTERNADPKELIDKAFERPSIVEQGIIKTDKQNAILKDQSRRQQGQISKPPLKVVASKTPQTSNRFDSKGYTPKPPPMMSSGSKTRSSRGRRKKVVAKPSRSNYNRNYSRLVGGR